MNMEIALTTVYTDIAVQTVHISYCYCDTNISMKVLWNI